LTRIYPTYRNLLKALVLLMVLYILPINGASAQYTEYQMKAGWLINFAKYVTWPDKVFKKEDSPFIIAIYGDDPFGDDIDRIARNRKVSGRPIIIKRSDDMKELSGANLVFFSNSNTLTINAAFEDYRNKKAVLTVGDGIPEFCEIGGIINFRNDPPGTFEINMNAAHDAKLIVHSKLLRLAQKFVQYDN